MIQPLGPIQYLRDIIINEMSLNKKRVYVYDQKFTLPKDEDIFGVVEFKHARPYSSRKEIQTIDDVVTEIQCVNMQEHYTIGLFSRNTDALARKHEIGMAFNSIYSQQCQEANSFRIATISPVQDLSPLENTAILYRFDVDLVVLAWYEKTKTFSSYYDNFPVAVDVVLSSDEEETTIEFDQQTEE